MHNASDKHRSSIIRWQFRRFEAQVGRFTSRTHEFLARFAISRAASSVDILPLRHRKGVWLDTFTVAKLKTMCPRMYIYISSFGVHKRFLQLPWIAFLNELGMHLLDLRNDPALDVDRWLPALYRLQTIHSLPCDALRATICRHSQPFLLTSR